MKPTIDAVVDSSRYFVIRIEDGSGKKAYIGFGFVERTDSFDFSKPTTCTTQYYRLTRMSLDVALQDYTKFVCS